MKTVLLLPWALLTLAVLPVSSRAAAVGASGYTNDFSTQPAAADWSSASIGSASTTITNADGLDAVGTNIAASSITTAPVAATGNPPAATGMATWSSDGFYLQTRPTVNDATLLMCTLVNTLGADIGTVTISYDFAKAAVLAEEVEGHRAYYSLTGTPASWTVIPEFCSAAPGRLAATLSVAWPAGGPLYLLWADENGSQSPDTACQIDNFSVTVTPAAQVPVTITGQPTDTTVTELEPATFSVVTTGNPPPAYQWYKDDAPIESATNASYTVASVPLSYNNAAFYVVAANLASNVSYAVTSATARLTVQPDLIAPTVLRVLPTDGSTLPALTEIEVDFSEGVTGVDASDLLINGSRAAHLNVQSPDVYVFQFPPPGTGAVQVAWSATHGITDLAANRNPFTGQGFSYFIPPSVPVGEVRITEFMASNSRTLADEDGSYSDWIELQNLGLNNVNLGGWFLTDAAGNLRKWMFPSTNLGSGAFMVVFASGKDRRIPGRPLHTNFRLGAEGGYLALVEPDGQTIASEFSPSYPRQFSDVSYGFSLQQSNFTLLPSNSVVRAFVPADDSLGNSWMFATFDDSGWISGTNGVGFDTGAVNPGEDLAASLIVQSGPAVYFRMNEANGTTAANLGTNHSLSGTYSSVTLGAAGPRPPTYGGFETNNTAAQFNGTSSYLTSGASLMNNLSAFTMAGWIRPTATQAARTGLFGQNDAVEFGFIDSANLQVWTPGGGSFNYVYPYSLNQWHYVVVVGDGTNIKIYIDGALKASGGSATSNYGSSSYNFNIGGGGIYDATGNYFNGQIDEVALWLRALSATEIQGLYQASLTPTATVTYTNLIGTDVRTAMFGANSSCYVRYLFTVDDPSVVNRLTLRMKYDDGFAAYLNGNLVAWRNTPATLSWNSAATTYNPDGAALAGEDFNITGSIGSIRPGTNVLAIQGLNTSPTNSDFLIYAQVEALSVGSYDTNSPRYFTVPTPGRDNGAGTADLGPIITGVGRTPPPPTPLTTNDTIQVTVQVAGSFAPVTNVTLYWRIMWGPTNVVAMFDDGAHGDGAAGDGVYGATIPAGVATNGQMVRWFIRASDAAGRVSRWPIFANPLENAEYEGAMIMDATMSQLPVWYFFVDPNSPNMANIDTETAGRGSMYYDGEFYDNIEISLRGNTTAAYPKKSHHLNFNADKPLRHNGPGMYVRHTSMLSETADPAYLRTYLSFYLLDLMGVPSPFDYPVHVRLNNAFWGLFFHNDTMGPDQLLRLGYDPDGALYKAAGTVTPDYSSTGGFEKRTRLWEGRQDYDALAYGINEARTLAQRRSFIFDNLNIPEIINYLAVARWNLEGDDVWANMTLYRDTLGTREWSIIPFDLNVSWGQLYCGDVSSVFVNVVATNDLYKSHPLYGGQAVQQNNSSAWNRIYDVIISVPETRQMLLRRERNVLEKFIQPPGTSFEQGILEQHIAYMTNLMWPEMFMDRVKNGWPCTTLGSACGMYCWAQAWPTNVHYGVPGLINEFINPRRTHWWVTHCVTNTAKPIGVGPTYNAGIPFSQPANAFLQVCALDYNPASGKQAEEYVCLTNPTPFALDISGWQVAGAVQFTFAPGTIVPSNSVIYVSPDVFAFRSRTNGPGGAQGNFVVGPYRGQLSARGESVVVKNDLGVSLSTYSYPGNPTTNQQYLRITELMYHPDGGDENAEYIELKNISTNVTLDLAGVRFSNGIVFDFTGSAVTTLAPGQTVVIARDTNAFIARYGAIPNLAGQYAPYALNNGGERVQLVDGSGEQILDFTYDNKWYPITDGLGFSLVVVDEQAEPDAWNWKSNWRPSGQVRGSPGADDPGPAAIVPVVINEALTRTDTPPPTDSIELYNPTSSDGNIGGWFLTDNFNTPKKYRIPAGTILRAGCYLVFDESQFNPTPGIPPSFALSAAGEAVYVFSGDDAQNLTGYFHGFKFGGADNGVSFGRFVTSDGQEHFPAQTALTLGTNNAGPRVGPVVLSEIMYHPPETYGSDNTADEYIELLNTSAGAVGFFDSANPANTWKVTGGVDYVFPTNVNLAAGRYLLLVNFDPTNAAQLAAFTAKYAIGAGVQIFGPYQGKLNNAGDRVALERPVVLFDLALAYVTVDQVDYKDNAPWPKGADGFGLSLQRKAVQAYGNEPTNWVAAPPSAGAPMPAGGLPPALITQPANRTVVAYSSLSLSADATGAAPLSYQWRHNGLNIPEATNATLAIASFAPEEAGDYQVAVFNAFGSTTSSNATISVILPASIVLEPQSLTLFPRVSASFSVLAFSTSPLGYQWKFNGVDISDATNASYNIPSVEPPLAGDYTVLVSDAVGQMLSAPAQLVVLTNPLFTLQPTNRLVVYDPTRTNNTTFSCMATSSTAITYQWTVNGTGIPGATNTSFTISNVQPSHTGNYAVIATDSYGFISSSNANLAVLSKPAILQQPPSLTVAAGDTIALTVQASGTAPLWYRWRKNNSTYLWPANALLLMPNAALTNAGRYDVIVTNLANALAGGYVQSSNALVLVVTPPPNQSVLPGTNVTVRAIVGQPGPFTNRFLWLFNGAVVATGTNQGTSTQILFTNDLLLAGFSHAQEGLYTFLISNAVTTTNTVITTNPPATNYVVVTNLIGAPAAFTAGVFLDSDGDGLPDWWETLYGFNPTDPSDAGQDADGDGMTNLQEYLAGTNPRDAQSYLRLEADQAVPGGMVLEFNAVSNRAYAVYYREAMNPAASWQRLQSISSAPVNRVIRLTNAPGTTERYYRLNIPATP